MKAPLSTRTELTLLMKPRSWKLSQSPRISSFLPVKHFPSYSTICVVQCRSHRGAKATAAVHCTQHTIFGHLFGTHVGGFGITPYSPFPSTETFSAVSCQSNYPVVRVKKCGPPDLYGQRAAGCNCKARAEQWGGLDVLPHGQFPLHASVLISDFGSSWWNNSRSHFAIIGFWKQWWWLLSEGRENKHL